MYASFANWNCMITEMIAIEKVHLDLKSKHIFFKKFQYIGSGRSKACLSVVGKVIIWE